MFDIKIMKPDEIRVIDNFLDKKIFKDLQDTLLNKSEFPWFLNYNKVKDDGVTQFTYVFYYDFIPNSAYYNNLLPFFKILPLRSSKYLFNLFGFTIAKISEGFLTVSLDLPKKFNNSLSSDSPFAILGVVPKNKPTRPPMAKSSLNFLDSASNASP